VVPKGEPLARAEFVDYLCDKNLTGRSVSADPGRQIHGRAKKDAPLGNRFPGADADAHSDDGAGVDRNLAGQLHLNGDGAPDRLRNRTKGRQKTVSSSIDLAAALREQCTPNDLVVPSYDGKRSLVTERIGETGRVHHVGEHDRSERWLLNWQSGGFRICDPSEKHLDGRGIDFDDLIRNETVGRAVHITNGRGSGRLDEAKCGTPQFIEPVCDGFARKPGLELQIFLVRCGHSFGGGVANVVAIHENGHTQLRGGEVEPVLGAADQRSL
jgi:hypothetical protein